jgi:two-component system, LytTR family, response regulator
MAAAPPENAAMKIRTLIVDDEPLARNYLSSLLQRETDFELAGEFGDGRAAANAIVEHRPDLVFLDVHMPSMNGLDVLNALPPEASPEVVFITAYDSYAVQAFEARALDYLLKPFRRERFQETVARIRRKLGASRGMTRPGLSGADPARERIAVKCGDRLVIVRLDDLDYVRAAANYVQLHVGGRVHEVREKISTMEMRLPADRFLRVHRSFLVNLDRVQELCPVGGGEYMITLRNGKELPVGPSYPAAIRRVLAGAFLGAPHDAPAPARASGSIPGDMDAGISENTEGNVTTGFSS